MTGVCVIGRGSMLVHLGLKPFIFAAQASRRSTRICKDGGVALSTARLDVVFLSWGGEGRNRRAPHRSRLGGLRQACQVSGNLVDLLIVEIFVGYKCGHRLSCSLTNNAQKLSVVESMARQRFRKSAFAVLAVAKLAIILQTQIPLPNPFPLPDIRSAGCLSLSETQWKQNQSEKNAAHRVSLPEILKLDTFPSSQRRGGCAEHSEAQTGCAKRKPGR